MPKEQKTAGKLLFSKEARRERWTLWPVQLKLIFSIAFCVLCFFSLFVVPSFNWGVGGDWAFLLTYSFVVGGLLFTIPFMLAWAIPFFKNRPLFKDGFMVHNLVQGCICSRLLFSLLFGGAFVSWVTIPLLLCLAWCIFNAIYVRISDAAKAFGIYSIDAIM